jgi:catechol 2,3-dioxygenase
MTPQFTRRALLRLAGAASLTAAMAGAVRAEGGVLHLLDRTPQTDDPDPGTLPFANLTPIRCGEAALRVRDLEPMVAFYRDALGLSELERAPDAVTMGVDGVPLLHLLSRPDAALEPQDRAGLFHIALLMPTRTDLARWLVHAAFTRVPLSGFADHSVSEAIYLDDPEGNGLEIYADRPKDRWRWDDGVVTMGTHPLDVDALVGLTDTTRDTYAGAPDRLRIGHVHLRVGDVAGGRGFYETALGLDSTRGDNPASAFLSSGGYHHHVAMNTWRSAGAGRRSDDATGLDWFSLHVEDAAILEAQAARLGLATADAIEATDPWGTRVRLIKT